MSDPRKPLISPHAIVEPTAKIGPGTKVWHFANIMAEVEIGEDCMIASYVQLDPHTRIGDRTRIQLQCAVTGIFGSDVFIGPHTTFVDAPFPPGRQAQPRIGNRVVIGSGCVIFPVIIGDGAVIASGSVVTKNVPENSMWMKGHILLNGRDRFDKRRQSWESGELEYGQ